MRVNPLFFDIAKEITAVKQNYEHSLVEYY